METRFNVDNQYTEIRGEVPRELLDDHLSYYVKGYKYTTAYKSGKWDGRVRMYNARARTIPTGLVTMAVSLFRAEGLPYEIIDCRVRPLTWDQPITLHGIELRDYQQEAVDAALHCERGVLQMATNAGKTEVAASVIQSLGLDTLFLTHTRALMRQTAQRFRDRLGADVGVIGDGEWCPMPITCCSVKTLVSRADDPATVALLRSYPVIFSDECHRIGNNGWFDVLMRSDAYFRYGLSGTPFERGDGASVMLQGACGGRIYSVSNRTLIEGGYSATATIHVYTMDRPAGLMQTVYKSAYAQGIVHNNYRNNLIAGIAIDPERFGYSSGPVLIIVREIRHGENLYMLINGRGPRVEFVHGGMSSDDQVAALGRLRTGGLDVLISSTIADEGIDIPGIQTGIHAAGGKSSIRTLQRIGRGLRRDDAAGKTHLDWIDFVDNTNKHLLQHSRRRFHDYKAQDAFEIRMVEDHDPPIREQHKPKQLEIAL